MLVSHNRRLWEAQTAESGFYLTRGKRQNQQEGSVKGSQSLRSGMPESSVRQGRHEVKVAHEEDLGPMDTNWNYDRWAGLVLGVDERQGEITQRIAAWINNILH